MEKDFSGKTNTYFPNGEIARTTNYVNGKRNGFSIFYYENGTIQSKQNYSNNLEHGELYLYYGPGSALS